MRRKDLRGLDKFAQVQFNRIPVVNQLQLEKRRRCGGFAAFQL